MENFVATILGTIWAAVWKRVQKAVACFILKLLLPGFEKAQCDDCGGADNNTQQTRAVTVKVRAGDGESVTVTVDTRQDGAERQPELEGIRNGCRLKVCSQRLLHLLRKAASVE